MPTLTASTSSPMSASVPSALPLRRQRIDLSEAPPQRRTMSTRFWSGPWACHDEHVAVAATKRVGASSVVTRDADRGAQGAGQRVPSTRLDT